MKGLGKAAVIVIIAVISLAAVVVYSMTNPEKQTRAGYVAGLDGYIECKIGETACSQDGSSIMECKQVDLGNGIPTKVFDRERTCAAGTKCVVSSRAGFDASCVGTPTSSSCNSEEKSFKCLDSSTYIIYTCTSGMVTATSQACTQNQICSQKEGRCVDVTAAYQDASCTSLGGDQYCKRNGYDFCNIYSEVCEKSSVTLTPIIDTPQGQDCLSDPAKCLDGWINDGSKIIIPYFGFTPTDSPSCPEGRKLVGTDAFGKPLCSSNCVVNGGDSWCRNYVGSNYVCDTTYGQCVLSVNQDCRTLGGDNYCKTTRGRDYICDAGYTNRCVLPFSPLEAIKSLFGVE